MSGPLAARDAKGGRATDGVGLVADTLRSHPRPGSNSNGAIVAPTLKAAGGLGGNYGHEMPLAVREVAATLTSGSHPGSNMPGRHKEDDINLVRTFSVTPESGQGTDIKAVEVTTAPGLGAVTAGEQTDRGVKVVEGAHVRRLTPVECERLMGWPDGWTAPEGVKAPDSRRYHACGDGVVANVAEWIGRRLIAIEEERRGQ